MGAAAVLEMAAAIPPAKKSLAKEIAVELKVKCRFEAASREGNVALRLLQLVRPEALVHARGECVAQRRDDVAVAGEDALALYYLDEAVNHSTEMDVDATKMGQTGTLRLGKNTNLGNSANDADVGGLPAALSDETGFCHLQRVRRQGSCKAS
ncbi:hypothetical protein EYF80_045521 [Liparis tanakae]|uniref:Uncharacterized protein n=1 Tax=Liparis tanakae TaxID=230148 RepID=A0A4Z2FSV4_9TELE|nr:hypothetical protein EYF80_045521 [Liparis tanakae]